MIETRSMPPKKGAPGKRAFWVFCLAMFSVPLLAVDRDLVFVSLNPCVIFDTREPFSHFGPFEAEEQRSYYVSGSTANFSAQGGSPPGCGVPGWSNGQALAKAVFINYVAINPEGAG